MSSFRDDPMKMLFQSKLNKELGFLEEKDVSRPNKGGM